MANTIVDISGSKLFSEINLSNHKWIQIVRLEAEAPLH